MCARGSSEVVSYLDLSCVLEALRNPAGTRFLPNNIRSTNFVVKDPAAG